MRHRSNPQSRRNLRVPDALPLHGPPSAVLRERPTATLPMVCTLGIYGEGKSGGHDPAMLLMGSDLSPMHGMAPDLRPPDLSHRPDTGWKIGLVLDSPELMSEIENAVAAVGATPLFRFAPSAPLFEIAKAVERDRPDVLFVELARTVKPAAEWMADVRRGAETPFVVAVHPAAEPAEMIAALRAGASEFVCLPVTPAVFEALDRIGVVIESRRTATVEPGRMAGFLSPKGGCGASSVACFLSAALRQSAAETRILVADMDYQSPSARQIMRAGTGGAENPPNARNAGDALEAVRRLSAGSWREFVTPVAPGVDLLTSPAEAADGIARVAAPEQWRLESLFRFVSRQYNWVLADLGRHLNPVNWIVLQNIEELYLVTAPDVLALYQTRSVLQTLSSRGFDRGRIRIILNRNMSSPQDFWVEGIQQMFEMNVFGVIPRDEPAFDKLPRDRFEFPADTPFGRAISKIAGRMLKTGPGTVSAKKAA